jgi:hypothetical protein
MQDGLNVTLDPGTRGIRGLWLLIAGNTLLALVLILLQKMFSSALDRLTTLMVINALLGLAGIAATDQCVKVFLRNRLAILAWAVAYCAGYGAFLVWPTQLPLGLFMVASALSPPLAALIFGLAPARNTKVISFPAMTPMLLLILLAIVEGRFASGGHIALLFAFVLFSHTAIQYGLRATADEPRPPVVTFTVSSFNCILLLAILGARTPSALHVSPRMLAVGGLIAPIVLLLQYLHLAGLHRTTLTTGALGMSTAVPISLLVEEAFSRTVHLASMFIAISFVAAVLYNERQRERYERRRAPH